MMNRSRSVLAGLGATVALVWAPTAIGQVMVTAPPDPYAPANVIVVEPSETAMRPTAMRSREARRTHNRLAATDGRVAVADNGAVVAEPEGKRHFWQRRARTETDAPRGLSGSRGTAAYDAPRSDTGHIQSRVAMIETPPAGSGMPAVTALRLEDGSRVLVPQPMALTARPGERVNVDYAATGNGQRIATKFMLDSETEAP